MAVLDLDLERGLGRLLAQPERARVALLFLLGLPLRASALRTPRAILVELRVEPVVGLAELRGGFAALSEERVDLLLQGGAFVEELRAVRVELVLFLFYLVQLRLDGLEALGRGLRLGIVELLFQFFDRCAICVDRVRLGLEGFDRPAGALGLADLLERALLVSKLQSAGIYLLLEIPER